MGRKVIGLDGDDGLVTKAVAMETYNLILNGMEQGLRLGVSPSLYNRCMEVIEADLRTTEVVPAEKFEEDFRLAYNMLPPEKRRS